jgi:hypothetical protein
LKGSISHEKMCSTRMAAPACSRSAARIMSSASSGDSVPEHMVATRSGRPEHPRLQPERAGGAGGRVRHIDELRAEPAELRLQGGTAGEALGLKKPRRCWSRR